MPPGRRGKYLGFVAHEIKNPLATALWSCDLLKRMDAADRAGPRADKMIDASLRAFRRSHRRRSRIRPGGHHPARAPGFRGGERQGPLRRPARQELNARERPEPPRAEWLLRLVEIVELVLDALAQVAEALFHVALDL